jgi:hypothetical protein
MDVSLIFIICVFVAALVVAIIDYVMIKRWYDEEIEKLEKLLDYLEFRNSINTDNDESMTEGDDSDGDDDN